MARKSQEYNHETEIIFALPSLQMNLQTKHVQDEQPPREDGIYKYIRWSERGFVK